MFRSVLSLAVIISQLSCSVKLNESVNPEQEEDKTETKTESPHDNESQNEVVEKEKPDLTNKEENQITPTKSCSANNLPELYKNLIPENIKPTQWVGNGSPESCNEEALQNAFAEGGTWGFKCGDKAHSIKLSKTLVTEKSITLDGGDLITLDGDNRNRVILGKNKSQIILSHLKIINGKASDNIGAGGIHTGWRGNLGIRNVTFENNTNTTSSERGGGAISTHESQVTVVDSHFIKNSGQIGGAINNLLGTLYVYNTTMRENSARDSGGAIYVDGASLYNSPENIEYSKDFPRIIEVCGSRIIDNTASRAGGLFIYLYGNPSDHNSYDSFVLNRSYVKGNSATGKTENAGGLYVNGSSHTPNSVIKVQNSTFEENKTTAYGGGVAQLGPFTAVYENTTFWKNAANDGNPDNVGETNGQGGAVFSSGKGIYKNVTMVNNNAKKTGAGISGNGTYEFHNSIIAHNNVSFPWNPNNSNCALEKNTNSKPNNIQFLKDIQESPCGNGMIMADPFPMGLPEKLEFVEGFPMPVLFLPEESPALKAGKDCLETDTFSKGRDKDCHLGAVQ